MQGPFSSIIIAMDSQLLQNSGLEFPICSFPSFRGREIEPMVSSFFFYFFFFLKKRKKNRKKKRHEQMEVENLLKFSNTTLVDD